MDSLYAYYNKIVYEYADPRAKDYFLVDSPLPLAILLIAYWLFIKKVGPAFMKNRPPYDIKLIIQIYNLLQVGVCAFFVCRTTYIFFTNEENFWCIMHNGTSNYDLAAVYYSWFYYMLKIADLLDTIFFVLRKKFNLITTLHTYHHLMMVLSSHLLVRYYSGGETVVTGMLNCLVHVFMYYYYFYCINNTGASKNIWWKKYITQLQLAQFCFLVVYYGIKMFMTGCEYPKYLLFFAMAQAAILLQMFGRYYYNAFIKPKASEKKH